MSRSCARCGDSFEAKTARAVYCSGTCRAMAGKARAAAAPSNVVRLPAASRTSLASAVRAELDDQADSALGRQAIILAERLDDGVSDASLASISKRLQEVLAVVAQQREATAAVGTEADPIEVLKRRAEARRVAG